MSTPEQLPAAHVLQNALKEALVMALDEVWFAHKPKGYGVIRCSMCFCNVSDNEEHGDGCYYNRLNALIRQFCPEIDGEQGQAPVSENPDPSLSEPKELEEEKR